MGKNYDHEKFEDIEIYPVEKSAQGCNAYYHRCEEVGHSAPYASCLARIEDRKQGRLPVIYAACSVAIGKKVCPAMAMRREELAEGRAIYFLNRTKMRDFFRAAGELLEALVPSKWLMPGAGKKKPVVTIQSPLVGSTYGAAINEAIKQANHERDNPSTLPQAMMLNQSPVSTSGMSPMQIARMRAQMKGPQ